MQPNHDDDRESYVVLIPVGLPLYPVWTVFVHEAHPSKRSPHSVHIHKCYVMIEVMLLLNNGKLTVI